MIVKANIFLDFHSYFFSRTFFFIPSDLKDKIDKIYYQ